MITHIYCKGVNKWQCLHSHSVKPPPRECTKFKANILILNEPFMIRKLYLYLVISFYTCQIQTSAALKTRKISLEIWIWYYSIYVYVSRLKCTCKVSNYTTVTHHKPWEVWSLQNGGSFVIAFSSKRILYTCSSICFMPIIWLLLLNLQIL